MTDRNFNRDRGSQNKNDWDWTYYEYRYDPYSGNSYEYTMYPYGRSNYGRYSGVGPRGYQRSDERIEEDINDRLTWHGYIDARDIQVDVKDGVVTLTGSVNDRRQKRMAEDIADSIPGVQDVNNELSIQGNRSGASGMNDQRIRPGMEVIGKDGNHVGEVKQTRADDFLVDRTMARDVYIPLDACQIVDGQIRLNIRADEVDNQGWQMPDLLGGTGTSKNKR